MSIKLMETFVLICTRYNEKDTKEVLDNNIYCFIYYIFLKSYSP